MEVAGVYGRFLFYKLAPRRADELAGMEARAEEWQALSARERQATIDEEVRVASPYLDRVARKLYHGDGLDRHDFITYFETNGLKVFEELLRNLQGLGQFKYFAFRQAMYVSGPRGIHEALSSLLGGEAGIAAFPGGVTAVPASPREGGHMTIRYDGRLSRAGAGQVFLHMGHGETPERH